LGIKAEKFSDSGGFAPDPLNAARGSALLIRYIGSRFIRAECFHPTFFDLETPQPMTWLTQGIPSSTEWPKKVNHYKMIKNCI